MGSCTTIDHMALGPCVVKVIGARKNSHVTPIPILNGLQRHQNIKSFTIFGNSFNYFLLSRSCRCGNPQSFSDALVSDWNVEEPGNETRLIWKRGLRRHPLNNF